MGSSRASTSVCILRAEDSDDWIVSKCQGPGTRRELARFATREEAAEYALAERDRCRAEAGEEAGLEMPDDCPCYRNLDELMNRPDPKNTKKSQN